MKKNWISIFEIITLVALFFAPLSLLFVDTNLLFPYITSKNFAWRLAIDIALFSWMSLALLDVRYRINLRNPIVLSFSFFVLVILLANTLGVDPYRSFWSNAERMDGFIGLIHIFGFFTVFVGFMQAQFKQSQLYNWLWIGLFGITAGSIYAEVFARNMVSHPGGPSAGWFFLSLISMMVAFAAAWDKPTITKSFFHGLLSLGVLFGFIAILQTEGRADSILGNPIYLASYSSFALFMSVYYMLAKEKLFNISWLREGLYGSLIVYFVVIIFESSTRGAVLGLVFGGFTTALLLFLTAKARDEKMWRWTGLAVCIFTVMATGLFFGFKAQISQSSLPDGNLLKRASQFSAQDTTTKHRLINWEQAIMGFKERPLLGWGQESYIHVFSKNYQANKLYNAEPWFDRTHNMFLDWLVFGGILGLGSFLTLLGVSGFVIWRRTGDRFTNLERSVLTGVIIAYMAQNFVAFDALTTGLWISAIFAFISLHYVGPERLEWVVPIKNSIAGLSIGLLAIVLVMWTWHSYIVPRRASAEFLVFMYPVPSAMTSSDFLSAIQPSIAQAIDRNTFLNQEFAEQLLSRRDVYLADDIDIEVQKKYTDLVATETLELIQGKPHLTRLYSFYGSFLQKIGLLDEAQIYLEQALATSPQKLQILWSLGQNQLLLHNYESALDYLKRAADYAPDSEMAQQTYLQVKEQVDAKQK